MVFQYCLHIVLKIAFDSQLYRVACCCRLGYFVGYDHSRRIPGYGTYAVLAAQSAFHSALNTPLTGGIVQAVAFV